MWFTVVTTWMLFYTAVKNNCVEQLCRPHCSEISGNNSSTITVATFLCSPKVRIPWHLSRELFWVFLCIKHIIEFQFCCLYAIIFAAVAFVGAALNRSDLLHCRREKAKDSLHHHWISLLYSVCKLLYIYFICVSADLCLFSVCWKANSNKHKKMDFP